MGFESYNEVIFCSSPEIGCVLLKEKTFASRVIGISIRSKADAEALTLQLQGIFQDDAARFCLFLDSTLITQEIQILEHICFLLYHTRYLFQDDKAIIYLVGILNTNESTSESKIDAFAKELGFDTAIRQLGSWSEVENSKDDQLFQVSNMLEPAELASLYKKKLLSNAFVDKTIIAFVNDRRHALGILKTIEAAEEEFRAENGHLHTLFQNYRRMSNRASLLSAANKQLDVDLKNQQKYLAVLRNEKEMEKIIEFYHREYEVLPLWYKRFGHIIKFITGKRKPRSNQKRE